MKAFSPAARLERRKRLGRFAYGMNGAIFLIGAWDGMTSSPPAPPLLIGTSLVSGAIQIGALIWSRAGEPPERLANALAAAGMFINAIAAMHHKSGIQYAYIFAGLIYVVLAWLGLEKISHLIKHRNSESLARSEE